MSQRVDFKNFLRVDKSFWIVSVGGTLVTVGLLGAMYAVLQKWPPQKRKRPLSTSQGFLINSITVAVALSVTSAAGVAIGKYSAEFGTATLMIAQAQVAIVSTFFAYMIIFKITGDDQDL